MYSISCAQCLNMNILCTAPQHVYLVHSTSTCISGAQYLHMYILCTVPPRLPEFWKLFGLWEITYDNPAFSQHVETRL